MCQAAGKPSDHERGKKNIVVVPWKRVTHDEQGAVVNGWSVTTFLTLEEKNFTWTVFLILCEGPGYSGEYRSVRKSELISVDFPRPDSPESQRARMNGWKGCSSHYSCFFNPLFPDWRVTWHNLQMFIATTSNAACGCLTFFTWFRSEHFSVQEIVPFNLLSFFPFIFNKITSKHPH